MGRRLCFGRESGSFLGGKGLHRVVTVSRPRIRFVLRKTKPDRVRGSPRLLRDHGVLWKHNAETVAKKTRVSVDIAPSF